MYCPKCGSPNDDQSKHCVQCGEALTRVVPPPPQAPAPGPAADAQLAPLNPPGPGKNVPTYLAPAILATLFCCLPPGVVAIVFAAQVSSKLTMGDHAGALAASRQAKIWSWVAFGLGLAHGLFWVVMFALGMGLSMLNVR
ncbi:MAG TPA: CD225/dispanin family protein [Polyangia bacterium]|nr:CD225/dispanin family protein [Polyangia bacterium]